MPFAIQVSSHEYHSSFREWENRCGKSCPRSLFPLLRQPSVHSGVWRFLDSVIIDQVRVASHQLVRNANQSHSSHRTSPRRPLPPVPCFGVCLSLFYIIPSYHCSYEPANTQLLSIPIRDRVCETLHYLGHPIDCVTCFVSVG